LSYWEMTPEDKGTVEVDVEFMLGF